MTKMLLSKKEESIRISKSLICSLACPICSQSLYFAEQLCCPNNHSFDFSKTGYLNLSNQPNDPLYTREFFEHRHFIMGEKQFYEPLLKIINQAINDASVILDAGTGEGTLFHQIKSSGIKIGIDLSKQGIQLAAKYHRNILWMVADLTTIPLKDKRVDVLLSILSPANYKEFKRVLKDDALLIKVLPGKDYFKELRFHHETQRHDESLVLNRFKEEFENVQLKKLKYQVDVDSITRQSLLAMSPLAWDMNHSQKDSYLDDGEPVLTIDLIILIART